jgi:hypothetical protein
MSLGRRLGMITFKSFIICGMILHRSCVVEVLLKRYLPLLIPPFMQRDVNLFTMTYVMPRLIERQVAREYDKL